ncbi:MAG: hypothetical protein JRI23_12160 [Deltaproteobacteria bacterium]|jgi:hypothetical protein|nr:hypothetical protein [Deltaproteobacteria bacterium]MBW2532465.1 hypothetical protein [Deltaproteobacteria bacterium]
MENLQQLVRDLQHQVVELGGAVGALRAAERERARSRRRAVRWAGILALLVGGAAGVAVADPDPGDVLDCADGDLFCFDPGRPARSGEVNHNFAQVKAWLEQKVGTVGIDDVDVGGKIMADEPTSSYDVWIQGSQSASGGDNRNLAMLGYSETNGDRLVINYNSEYAAGTRVNSNLEVTGELTAAGATALFGGAINRSWDTEYTAPTDGFVYGFRHENSALTHCRIYGYVGTNCGTVNTPSCALVMESAGRSDAGEATSVIMFPVGRGDHWRVTYQNGDTASLKFMPLGTSQ